MSPFELLGLTPEADVRSIRQAYAQRLRVTRPDDDPEGFQRLHAAYQMALEHCRGVAADASPSPPDSAHERAPVSRVSTLPAIAPALAMHQAGDASPAPPRFDVDAFCVAAFELAATGDTAALTTWLGSEQALWSLQLKSRTGRRLVETLYQQVPPMPSACCDVLLGFFDMDHALAGHDPLVLLQVKRRMHLAWQLQDADEAGLRSRLELRTALECSRTHWILAQLQRPFRWLPVLWLGLHIDNPRRIAEFVQSVSERHPEDLPPSINRTQLGFWLAAADSQHVTRPRWILGGVRSAVILLLAALLAPLISLKATGGFASSLMLTVIGILMVPSALWAAWLAWSMLVIWYVRPEPDTLQRSGRLYVVPAMCIVGVALGACGQEALGLTVVIPALWLAVRRYWYQHTSRYALFRSGYARLMLLLAVPVLHGVLNAGLGRDSVSFGDIVAAVAMVAWAADLRKQRRSLRSGE